MVKELVILTIEREGHKITRVKTISIHIYHKGNKSGTIEKQNRTIGMTYNQ